MVNSVAAVVTASLICLQAAAIDPPAYGLERHVVVANDMRQAIIEIYVSSAGSGNWQQDVLGPDYLQPGGSALVSIDDRTGQCRFDVKTVLDDGTTLVRRSIDVCRTEGYALSYR
ncbi:MAG TPA: hypothetical protein VGR45_13630 [Stellaceae bacterium]|nr:hypothetical protein [Stellaceae bacterium]